MRRLAVLAAAGGTLGLLMLPVQAQTASVGDESGAMLLLEASKSAQTLSYTGTQFVVFWSEAGSTGAVVDVSHSGGPGGGSILRVTPTPANPAGYVYHEDANEGVPSIGGVDSATIGLLRRNYEAVRTTTDSVAGRLADIVVVRRPGNSPAARFWVDRETHLVLRREVLDTEGRTVEASSFITIDLRPGEMVAPVNVTKERRPSGETIADDEATMGAWRHAGWVMPESLPGGLELVDVRASGYGNDRVVHLSYSDGISTVSVFQQKGRLDTSSLAGWQRTRVGSARAWVKPAYPRRVVWTGGGKVFTLVADCQRPMLEDIVDTLPHNNHHRGLVARVGHGLGRVGSWLNPFA